MKKNPFNPKENNKYINVKLLLRHQEEEEDEPHKNIPEQIQITLT